MSQPPTSVDTSQLDSTLSELNTLVGSLVRARAAGQRIELLDLERIGQLAGQRSLRAAVVEYNDAHRNGGRTLPTPSLTPPQEEQRLLQGAIERQVTQIRNLGPTGDSRVDLLVREILVRVQEPPHRLPPEQIARLDEVAGGVTGRAQLVVQLARQLCTLSERLAQHGKHESGGAAKR